MNLHTEWHIKPEVPDTDQLVEERIKEVYSAEIRETILGIYRCHRGMGLDVLPAWKQTLLDTLKGLGYKKDE